MTSNNNLQMYNASFSGSDMFECVVDDAGPKMKGNISLSFFVSVYAEICDILGHFIVSTVSDIDKGRLPNYHSDMDYQVIFKFSNHFSEILQISDAMGKEYGWQR